MRLLDTNHCFGIIVGDPGLLDRADRTGFESVVTSIIVAGELYYGATKSDRVGENWSRVSRFLNLLEVIPVSSSVAAEYAHLKAALLHRFGPRERAKRRAFDLTTLGFGDNDLWIAATAIDRGAVLVSADAAFARMATVVDLAVEDWTRP